MSASELFLKYCYKILKADLANDSYAFIKNAEEFDEDLVHPMEYKKGLSALWESYASGSHIYSEDMTDFKAYVNVPFVSEFFRRYHGAEIYQVDFRLKVQGEYRPIHLEIIATEEYTDERQIVYIFLRDAGTKLQEDYVHFNELLRGLSENYGAIYYVDFDRDVVRPFRMNAAIEEAFGDYFRSGPTYDAAIRGYINTVVSEKDREEMLAVTKYEYMRDQLKDVLAYSHEYRLERGGREYVYRFKIANLDGVGELHHAVMGFANVSSEKSAGFGFYQQGRMIMVAEDNEEDRRRLCSILERDYEVIAVSNGKEALAVLNERYEDIALIMTELKMPVMDGYELLRQIKRDRQYSAIPVLVCTDMFYKEHKFREEGEELCLELGVADFVLKPVTPLIVMNRVRQAVRLQEASAMLETMEKDSLTGLYAKEFFYRRVAQHLKENPDEDFAMWVTDIQGLKAINERYGIETGDKLLKIMAGPGDHFDGFIMGGRIEGDKFAALITEASVGLVREAAQMGNAGIDFPVPNVVVKSGLYHIRRRSTLAPQGMYDRALLALQTIKDSYGVNYAEYDDELRKRMLLQRQVVDHARLALEDRQFVVYYQPKFDLKCGMTNGAEALIRWIHPEMGFMNPGVFIPQFELNGFIKQLDLYVWEEVCKSLSEWRAKGKRMVPVSVNVSRRDFEDEDLAERVIALVDGYGIDHSYFHVEVTESAYSENPQGIAETIRKFHDNGFAVELDDFGSGYSSMSALSELNLDVMKLDMSLIRNDKPDSDRSVLGFSVQLAKMMKLKTVAEGVETEEQAKRISSLGGDFIQGYYYSKPLPKEEFERYLENESVRG